MYCGMQYIMIISCTLVCSVVVLNCIIVSCNVECNTLALYYVMSYAKQ